MDGQNLKWDAKLYQKSSLYQFKLGLMTIERLKPLNLEKILEIGSGNGMLTIELAKRIPNGDITAVEPSKEMIKQAEINLKLQNIRNVNLINKSALEIEYNKEFDAVFSNSAIHWIKNQELLYKLIYNSLKPNGHISIQTGLKDTNNIIKTGLKIFELKEFNKFLKNFKSPWRFLTIDETYKILSESNFKTINIEPYYYKMDFKNEEELLNYFKASTFVPFFEVLPEDLKSKFSRKFLEIFMELNEPKSLELTTPRLFITAKKCE
jgi:trans-aconitate 2-methyltransferase